MPEPLAIYLNDHIGGAEIALQLLEAMNEQHGDEKFRSFAGLLLPEIRDDNAMLHSITQGIGSAPSTAKIAGGWLLEKASRLKLGHTGTTDLELFESLELLALGIHGKLCLWKALQVASAADSRLRGYDFSELIRRANAQYEQVEAARLDLAARVF